MSQISDATSTEPKKVLIASELPGLEERLAGQDYGGHPIEVISQPGVSRKDFRSLVENVNPHVIVLRTNVSVDNNILDSDVSSNLEAIIRPGAGVDNVDMLAATGREVAVMYTPGANAASVATWQVQWMEQIYENLRRREMNVAAGATDKGTWKKPLAERTYTDDLQKNILVIGLGHTGGNVVRAWKERGWTVWGYDPYVTPSAAETIGVDKYLRRGELDEGLSWAQHIAIHAPLIPETEGLIGRRELDLMRKGATLSNMSRGGIVDEEAFVEAARSGKIAGGSFDVFTSEPLPEDHPLVLLSRDTKYQDFFYNTPHLAGSGVSALRKGVDNTVRMLGRFYNDGVLESCLNLPVDSSGRPMRLGDIERSKMLLAQELAHSLAGEIYASHERELISKIEIRYGNGIFHLSGDGEKEAREINLRPIFAKINMELLPGIGGFDTAIPRLDAARMNGIQVNELSTKEPYAIKIDVTTVGGKHYTKQI